MPDKNTRNATPLSTNEVGSYKLSYSGEEVNTRLGRLDSIVSQYNGVAVDLQVTGLMSNDNHAVNVGWVNRKLTNYLSLSGTNDAAPIMGDIKLNGKVYDLDFNRALFTYDLLSYGGYHALTKTERDQVIEEEKLEEADFVQFQNLFVRKTEFASGSNFNEATELEKLSHGKTYTINGETKVYKVPKYKFAHLALLPRHLLGDPSYLATVDNDWQTAADSAEYGYGIEDVTFTDKFHEGHDAANTGSFVTIQLGTERDGTPIKRDFALASKSLLGYNLNGTYSLDNGIPTGSNPDGAFSQAQIKEIIENLITNDLIFSGDKVFNNNVTVEGTLDVTQDTTIHANLGVNGNETVEGTLTVNDDVTAPTFIGDLQGNADSATKFKTGRTIHTDLASEAIPTFDGTADTVVGVEGILPIAHGGTAKSEFIGNKVHYGEFKEVDIPKVNPNDDEADKKISYFLRQNVDGSDPYWTSISEVREEIGVTADRVKFIEDITLSGNYTQIGNITKGATASKVLHVKNRTVKDVFTEIFTKKEQPKILHNPKVTNFSISSQAVPVGTTISSIGYTAAIFDKGAYTSFELEEDDGSITTLVDGSNTGVSITSNGVSIQRSLDNGSTWTPIATLDTPTEGTDNNNGGGGFQMGPNTKIKYKIVINHSAGIIAKTNTNENSSPVVQIPAGVVSQVTSNSITAYWPYYYGTKTSAMTLNSANIRALTKSRYKPTTLTVSAGTAAIYIALPPGASINKIFNKSNNTDITSVFSTSNVTVAGENNYTGVTYKVYSYVPAAVFGSTATLEIS